MGIESRVLPSLASTWIERPNVSGHAHTNFTAAPNPMMPALTLPRTLPSPIHPASLWNDGAMRQHERALVDSLDRRPSRAQTSSQNMGLSLSPISEQSARLADISLASPKAAQDGPLPGLPEKALHHLRRRTLAEVRPVLLHGVQVSQQGGVGTSAARRRSLPATPLSAGLTAGCKNQLLRQRLQARGHSYLCNAALADCMVSAVALRKLSNPASGKGANEAKSKESWTWTSNRVTIRARVHPRGLQRKPFLLQRTFDLDELRQTIPDSPLSSSVSSCESSADLDGHMLLPARRLSQGSAGSGLELPASISRTMIRGTNAVPIYLQYARMYLPVLAALILSGHVHHGDTIDLPLPQPEAWPQTVAHLYTGQGELTEAMKQNVLYLGGKA